MRVKITKGPLFPLMERKAHQLLYHIISAKMMRDENEDQQGSIGENVSDNVEDSH
jgi:hypothetical protein